MQPGLADTNTKAYWTLEKIHRNRVRYYRIILHKEQGGNFVENCGFGGVMGLREPFLVAASICPRVSTGLVKWLPQTDKYG